MNRSILKNRTWLNLISAFILLVGLGGAVLIYQRAGDLPAGALGYVAADGTIYPMSPEDSKMYRHSLEVYGGKMNVMMDDFRRWFAGLWRGKPLAVIIAGVTFIVAFGLFYRANYWREAWQSESPRDNNPDGRG